MVLLLRTGHYDLFAAAQGILDAAVSDLWGIIMTQLVGQMTQERHSIDLKMRRETANIAELFHCDIVLRRRE